jgi:3-hydroxybutyryl-CoA dehydrogenase
LTIKNLQLTIMTIAVLAGDDLKNEFLNKKTEGDIEILWADSVRSLTMIEADVYFDLQFELDAERSARLTQLLPKPVFINSVSYTLANIGFEFMRINAWPGMLQRDIIEVSVKDQADEIKLKEVFQGLGWKYVLVPDISGFITPRVIAMIINEAYFTFGAGIATREDIDTAMKLGTNYPFGPFEWCARIGSKKVAELLTELSRSDERYQIAPAFLSELSSPGS